MPTRDRVISISCRHSGVAFVHRKGCQEIPGREWVGIMLPFLYESASDTFKPYGGDRAFREENLLPVLYACNDKRLYLHGLPSKVTRQWPQALSNND